MHNKLAPFRSHEGQIVIKRTEAPRRMVRFKATQPKYEVVIWQMRQWNLGSMAMQILLCQKESAASIQYT